MGCSPRLPRIEAQPPAAERRDLQQAAGYRHILEEVDHLVLVGKGGVEDRRRRQRKQCKQGRRHSDAVAKDERKSESLQQDLEKVAKRFNDEVRAFKAANPAG